MAAVPGLAATCHVDECGSSFQGIAPISIGLLWVHWVQVVQECFAAPVICWHLLFLILPYAKRVIDASVDPMKVAFTTESWEEDMIRRHTGDSVDTNQKLSLWFKCTEMPASDAWAPLTSEVSPLEHTPQSRSAWKTAREKEREGESG